LSASQLRKPALKGAERSPGGSWCTTDSPSTLAAMQWWAVKPTTASTGPGGES
jgi:hypothetical protein